jgi:hypothetical protein
MPFKCKNEFPSFPNYTESAGNHNRNSLTLQAFFGSDLHYRFYHAGKKLKRNMAPGGI